MAAKKPRRPKKPKPQKLNGYTRRGSPFRTEGAQREYVQARKRGETWTHKYLRRTASAVRRGVPSVSGMKIGEMQRRGIEYGRDVAWIAGHPRAIGKRKQKRRRR